MNKKDLKKWWDSLSFSKQKQMIKNVKRKNKKECKQNNLENVMIQKYIAPQSPYYSNKQIRQLKRGELL